MLACGLQMSSLSYYYSQLCVFVFAFLQQSTSLIIEDDDSLEVDTDTEDIEDETSNVSEVVTLVKKGQCIYLLLALFV